jgi:carbonic anhydrase
MKYVLLLSALLLNACALTTKHSAETPEPAKVELPDEKPALNPPEEKEDEVVKDGETVKDVKETPKPEAKKEVKEVKGDVTAEEIKPNDPNDASTDVEDVSQSQFSYIDQKYGDKKDKDAENPSNDEASGEDISPTLEIKQPLKKLTGIPPEKSLVYLKHGNVRFLKGHLRNDGQGKKDIRRLTKREKPHAIIFTTSDSRVSPEIIFDEKLGEIFVVRNFSMKVDASVLNSLEYATQYLGARLIVVMDRNYSLKKSDDISHAEEVIKQIMTKSAVLQNYNSSGQLKIIPAIYHLESGKVDFLN